MSEYVPAFNQELEEAILSGSLYYRNVSDDMLSTLTREHFYLETSKTMFDAIGKTYESTGNVDMVTLETILAQESFSKRPQVSISHLMSANASTPSNIIKHCEILMELSLRRNAQIELLKLTKEMTTYDGYELMDKIAELSSLSETQGLTARSFAPSEILARDKTKSVFLNTSISELDNGICQYAGQRKGQVEVTIADSGHGKTHYAMLKASRLINQGHRVHWFQLEDSDEKTASYFAEHCGKNSDNIIICDSIDDIEAIKREARMGKRNHATDHIVVDYVQNVVSQRRTRNDQVEYISGQLTKMAKELNVSLHLLSQVTMEYGKRHGWGQEPRGGDVRWSQQLKQDAHLGTSIFRPSMIETLVDGDMAKDWNDKPINLNSVFLRQWKVRGGQMSYNRVHLIHNDKGLNLMSTWQQENYEKNNSWRSNSPF
jgi:replicative DNA helicase